MSSEVDAQTDSPRIARWLTTVGRALSTDFCPSWNRWVHWLKNPFWVLMLATAGTLACGVFLNPWILALTALLLGVVCIGTVLPWAAMRGIECQVMFDVRRVSFGQPALVRLRIQNRSPLPVWGLSLINGFASGDASNDQRRNGPQANDGDEGIAFARVPGWSVMEYTWPFVASRRGLYPTNGRAEVETSFPFGLFRARRRADVQGQLLVWPETTPLVGMPDATAAETADDTFSDQRVGEFGDVLGTRPFREGDSLRRVHWAQTARQQTLIVTERQAPLANSIRITLDLPASITLSTDLAEHCVRIAASLCESLYRQHCRIELQFGEQQLIAGQSVAGLQRLMDALAVAGPADLQSAGAIRRIKPAHRGSRFQVTITTPENLQPGTPRQIVVVDTDPVLIDGEGQSVIDSNVANTAWICSHTTEPLSQFAAAWRKVVS
ncbi:MAG: DUF58 domain-containing protein [Fuerstiella sp.]